MLKKRVFVNSLPFLLLCAGSSGAQIINAIRPVGHSDVTGIVFDSLAGAPLGGAVVQLIAADNPSLPGRTTTADAAGRYTLPDVPPGRYAVGFLHPILDSIGIDVPPREFSVASGQNARIDIGTPSPSRLRAAICGPVAPNDSVGVLTGFVRDAKYESPYPGVTVTGEWLEYSLGGGKIVRTIPRRVAISSENGWFALCNVPSGGVVVVVAALGSDSTGRIEVQIPREGFARRQIFLGANDFVTVADTAKRASGGGSRQQKMHVGPGRISGTVTAADGGRPIANAQVLLTGGPGTRTNERGEWTIVNAPAGTRTLEVRAIGFYPILRHVDVVPGSPPVLVALSTMQAVLDTVRIMASSNSDNMREFLDRKRTGMGKYFTAEDILRLGALETSEVLRTTPGVFVERSADGGTTLTMRGIFAERCVPTIYIDDHRMLNLTGEDIDHLVALKRIAAIEVYTRVTPPQFEPGMSGCGAVVIWTK